MERQGTSMSRSCIAPRGFIVLLALSTFCPAVHGGFRPENHVIVDSETKGPTCVHAADLDGDGDLDALSASSEDNKIAWYANDGTGHFGPQQIISTKAEGARYACAADLDGDGDPDVLSASYVYNWSTYRRRGKITWYANDGFGQFGPQQVISTEADCAASVYAVDLDGDGDRDVLWSSAGECSRDIIWYPNDGTGHFGSPQVVDTELRASDVHPADLDGDGDLDLLALGNTINWYANDGAGHFGSAQVAAAAVAGTRDVHPADLDGDGDLDVLTARYTYNLRGERYENEEIAWYANDGSGHFGPRQVATADVYAPRGVCTADLDGDGDLDVLSKGDWGNWYANDGAGHFSSRGGFSDYRPQAVDTADLDRDGDLDILWAGHWEISWCENDGSGSFPRSQEISVMTGWETSTCEADLDGDGDPDVLSAGGQEVTWYANDGSGEFARQQIVTTEAGWVFWVHAADVDGDGDLDVLSASQDGWTGQGKIAWYANAGSGRFGPQQVISTEVDGANCVYTADLDGDGDLDVLSTGSYWNGESYPDRVAWYANDGSGRFGAQQVIAAEADGASWVYAADVDGDGDLDVLAAFGAGWRDDLAWYANDGSGRFGPERVVTTGAYGVSCVQVVDLDGDRDLDVLLACGYEEDGGIGGSRVAWCANDGSGRFGPQTVVSTEGYGEWPCAADVDGDGDLDVLYSSFYWTGQSDAGKIVWRANDGAGRFGPDRVITTGTDDTSLVHASDLDGDGDLDVLALLSGALVWYENDGSGWFNAQRVITLEATGANAASAADLDGDGDVDVLSTASARDPDDDSYSGTIAWYPNDGSGQFGGAQVIATGAGWPPWMYVADLDGDGDSDVLSAWCSYDPNEDPYVCPGRIAWYANDGTGRLGPLQMISTEADGVQRLYAADLDGDRDLDVLSASFYDGRIAWYANDGSGRFGAQQVIATDPNGVHLVYAADLDGDGDIDVLSAYVYHNDIIWYANDGGGHFGPRQVIPAMPAGDVYAADLDGDGDVDVLSVSSSGHPWYDGRVAWYANDGSGRFGPEQVITTEAEGADCVYAADLDGDGDLDVLSASAGVWTPDSWDGSKIAWYANDGSGRFGPQQVISTEADGANSVYAADLDGDGDLDVLSASSEDGMIAWYENE